MTERTISMVVMADLIGHLIKIIQKKMGFIYIITNYTNTVLYTGVTSDIINRIKDHKKGQGSSFSQRYHCSKLVYYEVFSDIEQAIYREKQIKHYKREWKEQLITSINPKWEDLYERLVLNPDM